jgi:uncharacterized protein (DUF58 family)
MRLWRRGMTDHPAESPAEESLLSPAFVRKLDGLSLALARVMAGRQHGERRSPRRGSSIEFADYRTYTHGDDLRRLDWNVYARLEKLFLKLYVEEEDLHVHLLLDASASMGFGTPQKLLAARRICAALGYLTLANYECLSVTALTEKPGTPLRRVRGRGHVATLFTWLQGLQAGGGVQLATALKSYALSAGTPGLVIIVSDFLMDGLEEGVRALVGRNFAPVLIPVLAPEEVHPSLLGDIRLVDAETGEAREISLTTGVLARYQQRLEAHRRLLEGLGNRYGFPVVHTVSDEPFDRLILRYLRQKGVIE